MDIALDIDKDMGWDTVTFMDTNSDTYTETDMDIDNLNYIWQNTRSPARVKIQNCWSLNRLWKSNSKVLMPFLNVNVGIFLQRWHLKNEKQALTCWSSDSWVLTGQVKLCPDLLGKKGQMLASWKVTMQRTIIMTNVGRHGSLLVSGPWLTLPGFRFFLNICCLSQLN